MSQAIPKTVLLKNLRERRKAAGLVRVECFVTPEQKERLAKYVVKTLGGECNVRIP